MSGLEGLIAILIVALMPVALVFISRHYALREKQLSLRCEGEGRRLEELLESKRLLEARLEALETIVCGVEFDLDQRLQRLGRTAPARRALPGSGLGRGAPGATAHESP